MNALTFLKQIHILIFSFKDGHVEQIQYQSTPFPSSQA